MARTNPNVNLQFCESHVVLRAILANGTVLRLGTGSVANIIEEDSLQYSYIGKILKDSQVKISTTQSANTFSAEAANMDKQLGLTINDISGTLQGAKIVVSKVFADPYNLDIATTSPDLWYDITKLRGALPNSNVTQIQDLSSNARNGTGVSTFEWKKINGQNALRFNSSQSMTISGSFKLAQIFAVVKFNESAFSGNGSIVGSTSSAPFLFEGGTNQFAGPFPSSVRLNGDELSSPFSIGNLSTTKILNIKTNDPDAVRAYIINNQNGAKINFSLSELVGFSEELLPQEEQNIEHILARKYGIVLPYKPIRVWDRKVLLTGEISSVEVDEDVIRIRIVSDIAPNVAFIAARAVGTTCPLVFKGIACGYSGPLTTCNKLYVSEGGCSGRQNQHRFGGVVIEGELNRIIHGDIDTTIGSNNRFWEGEHFPDVPRNREIFI